MLSLRLSFQCLQSFKQLRVKSNQYHFCAHATKQSIRNEQQAAGGQRDGLMGTVSDVDQHGENGANQNAATILIVCSAMNFHTVITISPEALVYNHHRNQCLN
jgi:hypothetical protein